MNYITTADIAADLGLERSYVTDRLTKRPDFPEPALRLSRKTVKWLRKDFEAWKAAQANRAAPQSAPPSLGSRHAAKDSGRGAH